MRLAFALEAVNGAGQGRAISQTLRQIAGRAVAALAFGFSAIFQWVVHPVWSEQAEVSDLQLAWEDPMQVHKNAPLAPGLSLLPKLPFRRC